MFTAGMPLAGELFFMYATMLIAVLTGVCFQLGIYDVQRVYDF